MFHQKGDPAAFQDVDLFVAEACGLDCANQAGISGSYALLCRFNTSIVNDLRIAHLSVWF